MRAACFSALIFFQVVFLGTQFTVAAPEGFQELNIGDPAPDFTLPGFQLDADHFTEVEQPTDGDATADEHESDEQEFEVRNYSLSDFDDAELLLVIFTCNHCPTAQAYEGRIKQLHADYKDRGLALVAITPNDDEAVRLDELGYSDLGDSLEDTLLRAIEQEFTFPYLYDGDTQSAALAYGAVATPHVFLFDKDRKLRYSGRIDDSEVKTVTSHDTRNAIEALLAGEEVPVEKTRTFGCSIKWSQYRKQAQESIEKWNQEPVEINELDEEGLAELVKNDTDDLLLVNVWATWCGPCIVEMPDFVEINRMYRNRNFRLAMISVDDPEQQKAALNVLKQRHMAAANYISTISSMDRFADLLDAKWAGPVPYTILIAPGGEVIYRHDGPIEPLEVRRAIVDYLGRTYASR